MVTLELVSEFLLFSTLLLLIPFDEDGLYTLIGILALQRSGVAATAAAAAETIGRLGRTKFVQMQSVRRRSVLFGNQPLGSALVGALPMRSCSKASATLVARTPTLALHGIAQ